MTQQLIIELDHNFVLTFLLEKTPIADIWLERMNLRHQWPLDDPSRFYNFHDQATQITDTEFRLKECIGTINNYQPIITRSWSSIFDQDFLNYLHHIFEVYHGLLDQQNTQWWADAPVAVREALAKLNILVHRAENVGRNLPPRIVCTWWGMPKEKQLTQNQMQTYGKLNDEFGGVYLNYVEIGKTLEDLSADNDSYIGDSAFQPFKHYSADFVIKFFDSESDLDLMHNYFVTHRHFFNSQGITEFNSPLVLPYRYKVAQLKTTLSRLDLLNKIKQTQKITNIYFT